MARDSEKMTMESAPPDIDGDQIPRDDSASERDSRNYRAVTAVSTLAGGHVRNSAGEDLGSIEEIMIDAPSGRVAYAVLSFGGILGLGSKLFAVPWEALTLNRADHEFILNVDKNLLKNAPGFDKENWPDMADPTFTRLIHSYYGYQP
jgi:sporulation protein YlmC with PRC-barrel domain